MIRLLRTVYNPKHHEERVYRLVSRLTTGHRHRPPLRKRLRSLYGFFRLLLLRQESRPWKTLWRVGITHPKGLEAAAGQEVLRIAYAEQAEHYIRALQAQIGVILAEGPCEYETRRLEVYLPGATSPSDASSSDSANALLVGRR